MDKETIIRQMTELIVGSINGNLNETDQQKLDEWLAQSPKNRALYERLHSSEYLTENYRERGQINTHRAWLRVVARRRRHTNRRIAAVAASVMLLLGGSITGWWLNEMHMENKRQIHAEAMLSTMPGNGKVVLMLSDSSSVVLGQGVATDSVKEVEGVAVDDGSTLTYEAEKTDVETVWHTLMVDNGAEYSLVLADGTRVHLNSGSSLKYPSVFREGEREVYLCGEGYFDVAHDAQHKFVVNGGTFAVAVYGTSFNVCNYNEDSSSDVTLVTGSVVVTCNDRTYDLKPDQQLVMDGGSVNINKINARNRIAWIDNAFYFHGERLDRILSELSRWYDTEIVFKGSREQEFLFTGFVPKYANIGQVLDVIRQTRDFDVEVRDDRIVVIGK